GFYTYRAIDFLAPIRLLKAIEVISLKSIIRLIRAIGVINLK
ncbi:7310_t:CDS:1, partial [Scutellospora calospora]